MFEIVQERPGFEEINTLAQDALAFFEMGKGKRRYVAYNCSAAALLAIEKFMVKKKWKFEPNANLIYFVHMTGIKYHIDNQLKSDLLYIGIVADVARRTGKFTKKDDAWQCLVGLERFLNWVVPQVEIAKKNSNIAK